MARWKGGKLKRRTVDAEVIAETERAVVVATAEDETVPVFGVPTPVLVSMRRGALTHGALAAELRALADELDGLASHPGSVA